MSISATEVKELRDQTGAGIMDCKQALKDTDGDIDEAMDLLRKRGLEEAQAKGGLTAEGTIGSYVHFNGNIGVIVEVNSETDFVAKNDNFQEFATELAMQIAAQGPTYVAREDVPEEKLEAEKDIIAEQMSDELEGKPEHVQEQIMEGKLEKQFFQQQVLLDQPYIDDADKTISDLLDETIAEFDENIEIRRFERYEVGEGIEVEEEDFAEEVADEIG